MLCNSCSLPRPSSSSSTLSHLAKRSRRSITVHVVRARSVICIVPKERPSPLSRFNESPFHKYLSTAIERSPDDAITNESTSTCVSFQKRSLIDCKSVVCLAPLLFEPFLLVSVCFVSILNVYSVSVVVRRKRFKIVFDCNLPFTKLEPEVASTNLRRSIVAKLICFGDTFGNRSEYDGTDGLGRQSRKKVDR
jgi:hypothetical protein